MLTSLNLNFTTDVVEKNILRLTNQLWKLIPMRENEENWGKQLDSVILEIAGLGELFNRSPQFLQLLAKLEGLKVKNTEFEFYRKTVFESISLLRAIIKDE